MSATALQPTAVTQAIRPAALVGRQVAALPVLHAPPRGAVAVAEPALADLLVRARQVDSLRRAGLRVRVLPVGLAVLPPASVRRVRLRVALRGWVARLAVLPAVATTGH